MEQRCNGRRLHDLQVVAFANEDIAPAMREYFGSLLGVVVAIVDDW